MRKFFYSLSGGNPQIIEKLTAHARTVFKTQGVANIITAAFLAGMLSYGLGVIALNMKPLQALAIFPFAFVVLLLVEVQTNNPMSKWPLLRIVQAVAFSGLIGGFVMLQIYSTDIENEFKARRAKKAKSEEAYLTKQLAPLQAQIDTISAGVAKQRAYVAQLSEEYRRELDGSAGTGTRGEGPVARAKRLELEKAESALEELKQQSATDIAAIRKKMADMEADIQAQKAALPKKSGLTEKAQMLHKLVWVDGDFSQKLKYILLSIALMAIEMSALFYHMLNREAIDEYRTYYEKSSKYMEGQIEQDLRNGIDAHRTKLSNEYLKAEADAEHAHKLSVLKMRYDEGATPVDPKALAEAAKAAHTEAEKLKVFIQELDTTLEQLSVEKPEYREFITQAKQDLMADYKKNKNNL